MTKPQPLLTPSIIRAELDRIRAGAEAIIGRVTRESDEAWSREFAEPTRAYTKPDKNHNE